MPEDIDQCWGIACDSYAQYYQPNYSDDGYFGPSETDPDTVHCHRHEFEAKLVAGWFWEPTEGCTGAGTDTLKCDFLAAYTVPFF